MQLCVKDCKVPKKEFVEAYKKCGANRSLLSTLEKGKKPYNETLKANRIKRLEKYSKIYNEYF